jgi:hypothetical protein
MRLLGLFKRPPYMAIAAAAAFVGAATCAHSTEPGVLQADVEAIGSLVLSNCTVVPGTSNQTCTFDGVMTNNGPGCASVSGGTTVSRTGAGAQVGSVKWQVVSVSTIPAGQTSHYQGYNLLWPASDPAATYHTTINWSNVACTQ